ncbi:PilZ domain-containing protein [Phreatobacter stygius]|uniref:PilZ domain-containing protein n=1 Tax=Phreatobacter stygius TaxID=1940610 RepID=A0A4D7AUE0_9HYPH|nr:PilZ domain-containing protein [Phreatobacter stygius]QCI63251.1 PilZ domain-containing protein [Phreatobacter stygius]
MSERRIAPRSRTFWKGTIVFPGGLRSVECTVRNFSETGARLDCGSTIDIPDHFELKIPQRGAVFNCQVAWRRGQEIGAHFVKDQVDGVVTVINEKLKALAAQNKKLLRQMNERDADTL